MRVLLLAALGMALVSGCSGPPPPVTLGTILEATERCEDREAFSAFLAEYGFCYQETVRESTFTYSTHFECGTSTMGNDGLRVNFAVSDDGGLNSSLTTKNKNLVEQYRLQLRQHDFVETERDENRGGAQWYASSKHPGVRLMWEDLEAGDGTPLWHIGFVWRANSPSGVSGT